MQYWKASESFPSVDNFWSVVNQIYNSLDIQRETYFCQKILLKEYPPIHCACFLTQPSTKMYVMSTDIDNDLTIEQYTWSKETK